MTTARATDRSTELFDAFLAAGTELVQDGADGITTSCGFLSIYQRELAAHCRVPVAASALMQIAYEYLKQGDAPTALPWARQAVTAAPNAFPARKALGQALLETGDIDGAIKELQTGITLAPDSPGLHFTLARAYQRAGRLEEATRERNEFTRLDRLARTQRSGAQSVGGK